MKTLNETALKLGYESWDDMYLDWFNNFSTFEGFSTYHGITMQETTETILTSKKCYELIYG